jgi:hypothetical protein
MPANTSLYGRVLGASPKQHDKNSWQALVVERAEWNKHSLPPHAFVVAQVSISPTNNQSAADPGIARNMPSKLGQIGRQRVAILAESDPSLLTLIKSPQDATKTDQDELAPKYPTLGNVGILRDKDGTTYLLSSKSNVKLPAGGHPLRCYTSRLTSPPPRILLGSNPKLGTKLNTTRDP